MDKVVFLYVRSFEWLNGSQKIIFDNQPYEGRVYLALKNSESGMYKMKLPKKDPNTISEGIVLDQLSGEFDNWNCDCVEVDEEAMTTLNFHQDDLEMMADEMLGNKGHLEEIIRSGVTTVDEQANHEMLTPQEYTAQDEADELSESLTKLAEIDPIASTVMNDLMLVLADSMIEEQPDDFASRTLQESNKLGPGGNLGLALWYMQTYVRTPKDQFLKLAVYFMYLELIRNNINRLNK